MWSANHTATSDALPQPDLISFGDASARAPRTAEDHWRHSILPRWHARGSDDAEVRHLVLAGVPAAVQAELWWTFLGAPAAAATTHYHSILADVSRMRERLTFDIDGRLRRAQPALADLETVTADVPRTLPDHQRRGDFDGAALQGVLDAIVVAAAADNERGTASCGYVQGLADVGAVFLLYAQPPARAFGCLRALCARPLLRRLFALDADAWSAVGSVFEAHVRSSLPELSAHLDALGLRPEFYLTEWLVPLWCRSLCLEAAALTLNLLLLEGDLLVLRAALGVISALAPALQACEDVCEGRALCSSGPKRLSVSQYRACLSRVALEPHLLRPLAPYVTAAPDDHEQAAAAAAARPPPPPTQDPSVFEMPDLIAF